ncbi:hypothetical protein NliqN6_2159 [Naganishia liquefaciens]|uniref:Phosphatidylserine decarboxylase proenzyme 1, mitochondrial n=1 Tax=Naganishia liquefaciens TaxID=104408 RepID=A0A8H3TR88_9TREE|nr:hypothetical protein NliqN6_2159 [Naganishia liquefaciens]
MFRASYSRLPRAPISRAQWVPRALAVRPSRQFTTSRSIWNQESQQHKQRQSFSNRMASAWKDTPTKWYPIPIALGAVVLLAVQYRKTRSASPQVSSVGDRIEVMGDGEHGAEVQVKSSGPWQVRVLGALPLRSLSQLWGYLNGLVLPVWFRPFGFKLYARIFGCNLEECEQQDLTQYKSLGEFFYRTLKPGLRPVDTSAEVVSPADGRVLHFGEINGERVEQVKGMTYSLNALLGVSGSSVNQPDQLEFANQQGKTVDDEKFAEINDISYSLPSLLGSSAKQIQVKEQSEQGDADAAVTPHTGPVEDVSVEQDPPTRQTHDAQVMVNLGTEAFSEKTREVAAAAQTTTNARDAARVDKQQSPEPGLKGKGLPALKPGHKLFFMVVYLAPGDYHRFHSPTAWVVERRRHFTGDLFSVSPFIANRLKDLFVLNERVALLGRWRYGFFSMVPVGATNVGSIKINFDQNLRTNERHPKHPPHTFTEAVYAKASTLLHGQPLTAGEEMGGFMLGSTIVMVFEAPESFKFVTRAGDKVKVGDALGRVQDRTQL